MKRFSLLFGGLLVCAALTACDDSGKKDATPAAPAESTAPAPAASEPATPPATDSTAPAAPDGSATPAPSEAPKE